MGVTSLHRGAGCEVKWPEIQSVSYSQAIPPGTGLHPLSGYIQSEFLLIQMPVEEPIF